MTTGGEKRTLRLTIKTCSIEENHLHPRSLELIAPVLC